MMHTVEEHMAAVLARDWWVLLLRGVIAIVFGVLAWLQPGTSLLALVLLFYIAIWAIATGALEIVAAIRLRREIAGEWLLILAGLASVVFGVVLLVNPAAGLLVLLWLVAIYAVSFGILLTVLAFRVRAFGRRLARS